jgi:N-acetylneuraminic acid mutarotase
MYNTCMWKPALPLAIAIAIALLSLSALARSAPAAAPSDPVMQPGSGTWATLAAAPSKRTEVVAGVVAGKIYVLGGFIEPSLSTVATLAITDRVEEYDPATDSWSTKAPLPVGLHHAGAAVAGGKLYVIGGYMRSLLNIWHPVATVYMYDPMTDAWSGRKAMPTPRGALAVVEHGGKLYAIGGYDRATNIAALEVYDPVTDIWTVKAPLPTPRDHLAAAVVNQRIYALGGRLNGSYSQNLAVVEAYDPQQDRWVRAADMPTPRSGITAGVIGDTIYVTGGEGPGGTFPANEAYRADTDRWHSMRPMPTGRHGLASAVVNGRWYVISGGPTPGGSFSNVNEMFTPPTPAAGRPGIEAPRSRASAKHVGTVMALLAAFDDAGALPPESSPEANQLIKGLIQFQAAFMRSDNPALQGFLQAALTEQFGEHGAAAAAAFRSDGWTSASLEAIVRYAADQQPWHRPDILDGFREFNVGPAEFALIAGTYRRAQSNLADRGQDLHTVYAARRREMPGAGL